mmetsp:Transcript_55460/g.82172  ORF Transcript_55460/g.82172 Transcript_55460/m.82172 type:complete len:443 (-) Transcript_55460:192-1520(-)|eukprot:CAMPEP_0195522820 /NCGR_PEP_ID=MMETSP0794_2-20130614/21358_1 /TAXON_ID=515487 /ORGANISM="Stephanopyxis turris, Strain CCMP 815" /LENGTH=442 /DNA_ID=CAMNT_0040652667 /DNA_START=112 /DNA_END=1440 /DNA_ORIENTATION=+
MNADLLAMLGGAVPGGSTTSNRRDEEKNIISIKAGKMEHVLQPNGKYMVSPNPRRGEINLLWSAATTSGTSAGSSSNNGTLKFEWRDRRTRATDHESTIFPEDRCTFSKIDTGRNNDRVYLLQYANSERRLFFWMQEKSNDKDEDQCQKFQRFLKEPATCAAAANGEENPAATPASASSNAMDLSGIAGVGNSAGLDNASLVQIMHGIGGSGDPPSTPAANTSGGSSTPAAPGSGGVDALSSILENLGMPPPNAQTPAATATSTTAATATAEASVAPPKATDDNATTPLPSARASGGTLTLADLQGAMAGLATHSPPLAPSAVPPTPLTEIASASAVESSGILSDPAVRSKLIELLPENQRNDSDLEENLRSPQVQQALKSLTSALSGEGSFNEVILNFQMNPEDGTKALLEGNPIQAFLDCLVKSVEKKTEQETKEAAKED